MLLLRPNTCSRLNIISARLRTTTTSINLVSISRQYYCTRLALHNNRTLLERHTKLSPTASLLSVCRSYATEVAKSTNIVASKAANKIPKRSDFGRLLQLAKPEKWIVGASVVCLVVSSAITMSVPYGIGKIMDIIFTETFVAERLTGFCMVMVGVFVVGAVANFGRIYLMNGACKYYTFSFSDCLTLNFIALRIVRDVRARAYRAMINQEAGWYDSVRSSF